MTAPSQPAARPAARPAGSAQSRMVVMLPTLYHREPETEDSIALAIQAFEERHGHGRVLRMPSILRTLVDRARNMSVWAALKRFNPDFYLFGDHDMFYPTGDVDYWRSVTKTTLPDRYGEVNFIERMLGHPADYHVIGGMYRDKKNGIEYQCNRGHNTPGFNERYNKGELRGIIEDEWVATGAMRVSSKVIHAMIDASMTSMQDIRPTKHGREFGWFSRVRHDVGEDVQFCLRVRQLGFRVFLDLDLRCHHAMKVWV